MGFSREIAVLGDLTGWARGWGPPVIRLMSPEARRGHRARALVIRRVGGVGLRVRFSREPAEARDSAQPQLARSSLPPTRAGSTAPRRPALYISRVRACDHSSSVVLRHSFCGTGVLTRRFCSFATSSDVVA